MSITSCSMRLRPREVRAGSRSWIKTSINYFNYSTPSFSFRYFNHCSLPISSLGQKSISLTSNCFFMYIVMKGEDACPHLDSDAGPPQAHLVLLERGHHLSHVSTYSTILHTSATPCDAVNQFTLSYSEFVTLTACLSSPYTLNFWIGLYCNVVLSTCCTAQHKTQVSLA